MKKIILFNFVFEFLFLIFSLVFQIFLGDFDHEMYSYFIYFIVPYLIITFFINLLVSKILVKLEKVFYILFLFEVSIFLNIYVSVIDNGRILFLELFKSDLNSGTWYTAFSYHISICLSVMTMYFLSKRGILKIV